MAAFTYYSNVMQFVLKPHELNEKYLILLQEAIAPLRFYVCCRVCNNVLQEPMTPDHVACQHTVCLECVGKKMQLKPSCGWCKQYENFVENKSLAVLIRCYRKMCEYILSSTDYHKQVEFAGKSSSSSVEAARVHVAQLLKEGCTEPKVSPVSEEAAIGTSDSKVQTDPDGAISKTQNQNTVSCTREGDLKLKLIIPSGKRRRWLTAVQNQSVKPKNKTHTLTTDKKQRGAIVGEDKSAGKIDQSDEASSEITAVPMNGGNTNSADSPTKKMRRTDNSKADKKSCGCGNASSSAPGKLTCYGQRCPCYSSHSPCLGCRCKGCRNPNKIVKIEQASEDTDGDEINVE